MAVANQTIQQIFRIATDFAKNMMSKSVETEHLLYGVIADESSYSAKVLAELGVNKTNYAKMIKSISKDDSRTLADEPKLSKNVSLIFARLTETYANAQDVLLLLLSKKEFKSFVIVSSVFKLDVSLISKKIESKLGVYSKNKSMQSKNTMLDNLPEELKNLGINLNVKMANSDMQSIIGRDEEIKRVIEILCRKTKNNPVLVGEPGVGKSAIVEGLAIKINQCDVPEMLQGKIIFSLDLASLMAGTKFRGSMEERLKKAINAILANPDIIVFIDEIHMLAQAGAKDGEISPADILKPYLARGELHCVGATTLKEYKEYIEKDSALERRFQIVSVEEPSRSDTIAIIKNIRPAFEKFHGVTILDESIEDAVELSIRYITNRFLPDKAIDLIDEACSKIKLSSSPTAKDVIELNKQLLALDREKEFCLNKETEDFIRANEINKEKAQIMHKINEIRMQNLKNGKNVCEITPNEIRSVVSAWTKIPVNRLSSSEKEKLLNLERILSDRVIGQELAVSVVANAIRRSKADINDPNRPIGSFLFLGPTGVGKTELAKAVAEIVFGSENSIVRFDMSEFMEQSSVARLIGAPPGYVGHDEGGELTDAVKNNPYSVVLFDEIEKAHPDIFNLMLQILDEGRLTDSKGRHINFRNTIVILTSNNGVQELIRHRKSTTDQGGVSNVNAEEFLLEKLREKFKPELLNRIDQMVIFNHLSKESVLKITSNMLDAFARRLERKKIRLVISDEAKSLICDLGYDSEYGARPIRKVIDKNIKDVLANMIISGELIDNSAVKVGAKGGEFTFEIIC